MIDIDVAQRKRDFALNRHLYIIDKLLEILFLCVNYSKLGKMNEDY